MVIDAALRHFDEREAPGVIRLHFVPCFAWYGTFESVTRTRNRPSGPATEQQGHDMADTRKTLLARLAPMFGPQTENLAVEALGHILDGSGAARSALSEMLRAGGAEVGEVVRVRTQDSGEDGARPDLAGLDRGDEVRVLIEAKFWAGLTANQPVRYLKQLRSAPQPSALLFVAPARRRNSLWAELLYRLSKTESAVAAGSDAERLLSARIDDGPYMMLTSWRTLLNSMAGKVSAAADRHTETDIRQLQGLANQQDEEAFLPLRREELGPQFPRRVGDFTGIVKEAVRIVTGTECVDKRGAAFVGMAGGYGIWLKFPSLEMEFGESSRMHFGVSYGHWARYRDTPLWIRCSMDAPPALRQRLEPLRHENPPNLIRTGGRLSIPVALPVGKERGEVLDAVVAQLLEVARIWTTEPCEATE